MIESMITEVRQILPLKLSEVLWDGTIFHIYGANWSFVTLSAWRVSTTNKIIFGCYDENSISLVNSLKNLEIVDIDFQTVSLPVDPIFILSNEQKIEIFSTDTYEPWTFNINGIGFFSATPNEPAVFDPD